MWFITHFGQSYLFISMHTVYNTMLWESGQVYALKETYRIGVDEIDRQHRELFIGLVLLMLWFSQTMGRKN